MVPFTAQPDLNSWTTAADWAAAVLEARVLRPGLRCRQDLSFGPVWKGGQSGEAERLRSCYLESFRLAEESRIKSIAFPAISTGVYGYPSIEAASIATQTMLENESNFDVIIACCFSAADVTVYETALGRKPPAPSN